MSDSEGASNSFEPLFGPMMDYWAAYTQQWTQAASGKAKADPEQAQREWMQAAGESVDAYLRSPLFLQLLKHHITSLAELQKQSQKVESHETNESAIAGIVQHLERIEQRLAAIEQRLSETGGSP